MQAKFSILSSFRCISPKIYNLCAKEQGMIGKNDITAMLACRKIIRLLQTVPRAVRYARIAQRIFVECARGLRKHSSADGRITSRATSR